MEPIVWQDLMPNNPGRVMRGEAPEWGEFTLKGSEANRYSVNFTPKYPEGENFETIWKRTADMPDGDERDSWRVYISTNLEFGYFYDLEEGKRIIELARARPTVPAPPDTLLREAGFDFRHAFNNQDGAIKVYARHVKTGMFQVNRSERHVHATFEFSRGRNGWINLFRFNTMNQWQDGSLHPMMYPEDWTLNLMTFLAVDSLRHYEEQGHCVRKRKGKA